MKYLCCLFYMLQFYFFKLILVLKQKAIKKPLEKSNKGKTKRFIFSHIPLKRPYSRFEPFLVFCDKDIAQGKENALQGILERFYFFAKI